jgi:hypothetical protein
LTTDDDATVTSETAAPAVSAFSCSILHLPEEVICLIVARLDVASVAALEASCKHLRKMVVDARLWRRILVSKLELEPGLRGFLRAAWREEAEQTTRNPEEDHLRQGGPQAISCAPKAFDYPFE